MFYLKYQVALALKMKKVRVCFWSGNTIAYAIRFLTWVKPHQARNLLSTLLPLLKEGEYYVRKLESTESAASGYAQNSNKIERVYNK